MLLVDFVPNVEVAAPVSSCSSCEGLGARSTHVHFNQSAGASGLAGKLQPLQLLVVPDAGQVCLHEGLGN